MDPDGSIKMANGLLIKNNNNNIEQDAQVTMNDILNLIENEIPECQQNLKDNHQNLERVAEYCDTSYFMSNNKPAALEETKNYTTQSLASVAHQITSLAYNILHLLDLQTSQMVGLETGVNHLAQSEHIHREKVARREIGLFAANKRPNSMPKILYPQNPERPTKYIRKPIDYSILDDVGHGVKLAPSQQPQQQQSQIHTSRTRSISSAQSINGGGSLYGPGMSVSGMSGSSIQAPSMKPPTPPQGVRSTGTLSRVSREYRNPTLTVAPPRVPTNYAPNYPLGHQHSAPNIQAPLKTQVLYAQAQQPQQQSQQLNYSQQQAQQYGIGMVQQQQQQQQMQQPSSQQQVTQTGQAPPIHVYSAGTLRYGQSRLPPPPTFERAGTEPDWVPKNYIEKVIALYDYTKEKPDELNLCENAIIYVTRKNEDGWYEGVLDGEEGLFPCNYVEPLRDY